jgi:hypothetical protein
VVFAASGRPPASARTRTRTPNSSLFVHSSFLLTFCSSRPTTSLAKEHSKSDQLLISSSLAVKSASSSSTTASESISQKMSDPNSLKDILAKAPQNSHLGSKTIVSSGELDIGDMIEKSGCNDFYSNLEECLGENNRDWRKCQLEVHLG